MRRFEAWPTWLLRCLYMLPALDSIRGDIYIELYHRDVIEPWLGAADDVLGPWPCAPPPGVH